MIFGNNREKERVTKYDRITDKTAERLAFYLINEDKEKTDFFSDSIKNAKEKIQRCEICNSITDKSICKK